MTTGRTSGFAADDVRYLLRRLKQVVQSATTASNLSFSTKIAGQSEVNLEGILTGKEIGYRMTGSSAFGRGRSDRDGEIHLVPLQERPSRYDVWIGGFIRWRKISRQAFELDTLNWSFFTGRESQDDNEMRLRAEWHHDRSHPQPHWHFHDDLLFSSELGVTEGQLGKMHLPMAGWINPEPECWSHPEVGNIDVFISWSTAVINVAKVQLDYLLGKTGM